MGCMYKCQCSGSSQEVSVVGGNGECPGEVHPRRPVSAAGRTSTLSPADPPVPV